MLFFRDKLKHRVSFHTLLAFFFIVLMGCEKDTQEPEAALPLLQVPSYFPEQVYQFENNPISKERIALGRMLFYDPQLSSDGTISCASCHHQSAAFSDPGLATSFGVKGVTGSRNSPALFNLLWKDRFMWDGGINHIEVMPVAPITEKNEMNETLVGVAQKLNRNVTYKQQFKTAFGEDSITSAMYLKALAQFMSTLVSANAKYDDVLLGEASFTEMEANGYELFKNNCNSCHTEPLMTSNGYANNGIVKAANDSGRFRITLNPDDFSKFKIPSLRNVALSYPYMHNGSIATLEDVIEHYSTNIQPSETLAPELSEPFSFTEKEKEELLAFLNTLTDYQFINNTSFSPPSSIP
tara:strand:- start:81 stop:1139 length:1059 start_codon:yes stop_codon:yes gene_type:complete